MFDTARRCVEYGVLPEPGGLNDQDEDELLAMDIVARERDNAWADVRGR